ncbi:MAG: hypothetical protein JW827_08000, partial [Spirochaetes bacterium]|nr:hypothetical protein [Spirochaetota bacterium]
MKFKKQLIILLILALSISFIIMDIYAKRKESPVAKVKLVNGKVYWYNKGEKKKNNLKVNQILDLNSVVETLKKSSATLLLKGGAQI